MKRIVLSAFLVIGLTYPLTSPAQAIFGLSACEKAKKQIQNEEKIGLESWKIFHVARKKVIADGTVSNNEYEYATELLVPVLESDLLIYAVTQKNPSCFKTKSVVFFRNENVKTKRWLTNMNMYFRAYAGWSESVRNLPLPEGYKFLKNEYLEYADIVTDKVIGK
jgi:hypothetical protein